MKQVIKNIIHKSGYSIVRTKTLHAPQTQLPITRDDFFNLYFSRVPTDFFFLQIGANDGVINDPIREYVVRYGLRGMAVEPQPNVFKRLRETYRGASVECVNAAIGASELTFYTVKPSMMNEENFSAMTCIASFNKKVMTGLLKKNIPKGADPADYIDENAVPVMSLADLVQTYGIKKIDMLQLDCEGYDHELLRAFDFDRFSPSLINFESVFFPDAVREEIESMLKARGYHLFRDETWDTCAYKVRDADVAL
ncbi:MAG: FkbM family methyltransferase [bacterium]|nr:FkbM family methyltransferase [bacterium]